MVVFGDVSECAATNGMTPEEKQRVANLAFLSRKWGYRTLPEMQHAAFEAAIADMVWFQNFTDLVFRIVQQGGEVVRTDTLDKASKVLYVLDGIDDGNLLAHQDAEARSIINDYFESLLHNELSALRALANTRLTAHNSRSFATLVAGTRALVAIAQGKPWSTLRPLFESLIELWE